MGTEIFFPTVKRPGREADHTYLVPILRVRGAIPTFPHYVFKALCFIKQDTNPYGVVLS